jgi:ABC-type nitrate/sulfonate/bicarbonate transport system permease component
MSLKAADDNKGLTVVRPEARSRDLKAAVFPWLLRLGMLVVLAGLWELFARRFRGLLVPTVPDVVEGLITLVSSAETWEAFLISNQALALGFGASVITGVPIGFLMGRFRLAERIFNPYNRIVLVAPLAGFIPVLTLTLGLGLPSRVIIVWAFGFPMVVTNAQAGVRQVSSELISMARVFGSSEWGVWRRVLLPGSLPAVLSGLRIALGRSVTGMVIVELLMISVGIGGLILSAQGLFKAGELYGVVILVVIEAILLIAILDWLTGRLVPWRRHLEQDLNF